MPQTVYDDSPAHDSRAFESPSLTLITLRSGSGRAAPAGTGPDQAGRGRWIARQWSRNWDLIGVLALMASSAAYALFALTHLGL